MADLATFDANTGDWWVSASSGSGFWPPERWRQGHSIGSTDQLIGDFNADGKFDAAVYFAGNGNWYVSTSTGNGFNIWASGRPGMG